MYTFPVYNVIRGLEWKQMEGIREESIEGEGKGTFIEP